MTLTATNSTATASQRPQAGESAPYYDRYISLVPGNDILAAILTEKKLARQTAVNALKTKMTEALGPEARAARLKQIPLASLGQPGDVAEAALFFASPAARYITGQVLAVDGGMVM